MSTLRYFFKCFCSPSLYVTYRDENYIGKYHPDKWEKYGDLSLYTANIFWKISVYASPFLAIFFYRKGCMNVEGAITLSRITLWFGLIVCASYCMRSYGRAMNPYYRNFLTRLSNVNTTRGVADIKRYEFDFEAWPVEFHLPARTNRRESERRGFSSFIQSPCSLIGYLVLHTVGIRMIYPGSTTILNTIIHQNLMEGRKMLILDRNGTRYKLKTPEGNTVDTMLIDKRSSLSVSGLDRKRKSNILVICSEGNAGYYENGIMGSAIDAGFSVLGWNHPGFGCSTGMPYIDEEESAINTVMEFAIQKLGFPPEDIILYGWSIGGYAASWAAASYPGVKAVVVDASFDDVLPLALNQMPSPIESIVRLTIRSFADLNVTRQLLEYQGPIKMVRRADDEVIAIVPGDITTNRGNYLLKKILKRRYPAAIDDEILGLWLSTSGSQQSKIRIEIGLEEDVVRGMLESYVTEHGANFPLTGLGEGADKVTKEQITIYLAEHYMVDYASTHCEPLPATVFLNLVERLL